MGDGVVRRPTPSGHHYTGPSDSLDTGGPDIRGRPPALSTFALAGVWFASTLNPEGPVFGGPRYVVFERRPRARSSQHAGVAGQSSVCLARAQQQGYSVPCKHAAGA